MVYLLIGRLFLDKLQQWTIRLSSLALSQLGTAITCARVSGSTPNQMGVPGSLDDEEEPDSAGAPRTVMRRVAAFIYYTNMKASLSIHCCSNLYLVNAQRVGITEVLVCSEACCQVRIIRRDTIALPKRSLTHNIYIPDRL